MVEQNESTGRPVAVVTGAARGIGASTALALQRAGFDVAVTDLDGALAASVAETACGQSGGRAIGVQVDVADSASVSDAISLVESQLGPVDVLVNNAGIDVIGPFVDSDEATWERLIAVNLVGTIRFTRGVLDGMRDRKRGRVINMSSDAGRIGSSGEVVYSATKGGVIAFTKALARELARDGITVNCVCPGPTDTALLGQVEEANPKLYASLTRAIPLGRLGQPEDVAPSIVFLASAGAAFITGQTLSVSGGLTMS